MTLCQPGYSAEEKPGVVFCNVFRHRQGGTQKHDSRQCVAKVTFTQYSKNRVETRRSVNIADKSDEGQAGRVRTGRSVNKADKSDEGQAGYPKSKVQANGQNTGVVR